MRAALKISCGAVALVAAFAVASAQAQHNAAGFHGRDSAHFSPAEGQVWAWRPLGEWQA